MTNLPKEMALTQIPFRGNLIDFSLLDNGQKVMTHDATVLFWMLCESATDEDIIKFRDEVNKLIGK